jgi:hypothetical protein
VRVHAVAEETQLGWVRFAGALVILVGAFNVVEGITGLAKDTYFAAAPGGLLVVTNYDAWGGWWLALGALQVLVGIGVLARRRWARIAAVCLLFLAALGQIVFLVAFPLWSLVTIGLIVAAIHALTVHGEAFGAR